MSRIILYDNNNLQVVTGFDPMVGNFYQLFDKDLSYDTPDGEGLILEWSMANGLSVNYTDMKHSDNIQKIITNYMNNKFEDYTTDFNFIFLINK